MKTHSRKQYLLIFILLLFLISIETPSGKSGRFFIKPESPPVDSTFACINDWIPPDATALFVTQVDGIFNWEPGKIEMYFKTQYEVVPGLVAIHTNIGFDIDQYDWFIAYLLDSEQIGAFAGHNGLKVQAVCGDMTVLKRAGSQ